MERLINKEKLGVFEETAQLKKVIMWGRPSTEAVLAQLLPKEISCFEFEFKVPTARIEFVNAKHLLETQGVEVICVKDLLAQMIETKGIKPRVNLEELKRELKEKGCEYHETYKDKEISSLEVLEWIDPILTEDIKEYGENNAIIMNDMLSLQSKNGLPLANVIYARDQSNLLGNVWVWSSMEHDIRKEEVRLYKDVLSWAGIVNSQVVEIQVTEDARFEGGDGIVHNGICYIGVGGRTNLRGVSEVAPAILAQGLKVVAVYDGKRTRKEEPEMDAMHLDTFWMPCGENKVVVCGDESKRRRFIEITMDNNNLKISRNGMFSDHLKTIGVELIPLTKYEQLHYAPNFVNINNRIVDLSLTDKNGLIEELGSVGIKVESANLVEITKGYGGLHCMTAAIKRG